ncbi:MAG: N-acetyltransferase [Sulfuricurvum sp.]|uniref:N-acetyltransferase n=1 Tax=Sulfuricurvum sp. TaxID=2025608 RepID=UPI002617ADA0|nr:N-acetyltransferase [Sulfuricurvum sp.]MDD2829506.1 N-acetyltransferase [Sulfuricurvum sp.]MDD4949497.1 N-acetyltransferase [Sulfuricurvum sp.]
MQALVAPQIENGVILARSDDEIATNIRSYTLAMDGEKLIGFCALHIHSPNLAEIRSMIIDETYRGKKIGSTLVDTVCQEGKKLGLHEVLALTYQQLFFERLGFIEIPKESIPEHKIWADCIKCKHFPICNEVSLIKTL